MSHFLMEASLGKDQNSHPFFYFERHRLNQLFKKAAEQPLVLVCAGAGYGKTSAVHDFLRGYEALTVWIQLSERDNVGARFWENFIHTIAKVTPTFANAVSKLGFPDTQEKLNQYITIVRQFSISTIKRIIVFDDFHVIRDPLVMRFVECIIQNLSVASLFIISRSTPLLNITSMVSKGHVFNVSENDLRFTETELAQYFRGMEIFPTLENLREIMQDTEGWAFAINLIARSYQKAPGYGGYIRNAMKANIFRLMETEIWDGISEQLQCFLLRISLIDHLSFELIELLARGNVELTAELERQNAYIRRDSYINAYLIHPLFLEFLSTKQELLSDEDKRETYTIAGDWCDRNGFKIDALFYFEKTGAYASIVSIMFGLPVQIPPDIAKYASQILDRTQAEAFDKVEFLAVLHLRSYMCQGLWKKSIELAEYYEKRLLKLADDNSIKERTLSRIYFSWSYLCCLTCTLNDNNDFIQYVEKFCKCLPRLTDPGKFPIYSPGAWVNYTGSSRKGAPAEYIEGLSRKSALMSEHLHGYRTGEDDLARGEFAFFQGDLRAAEYSIARALVPAREYGEFGIMHLALLYTLRISIAHGNYLKAEQAMNETKTQLEETGHYNLYNNYDISLAWYYYILGLPEMIPDWLKQDFSPYGHAGFAANFGNQAKARYCYMTRNYPPLLAYIREMKNRESILFGRIEMLAIEACVHNRMKDRKKAYAALLEAYENAAPNGLLMPFIELGKDMRTLTTSALKESDMGIPQTWLENINRKAASYAKHQAHVIREYKQANRIKDGITLSPRETEILLDLSHGLSRSEISVSRNLSINTVKMVINNIYSKFGAENIADLIRIAVEHKLI